MLWHELRSIPHLNCGGTIRVRPVLPLQVTLADVIPANLIKRAAESIKDMDD